MLRLGQQFAARIKTDNASRYLDEQFHRTIGIHHNCRPSGWARSLIFGRGKKVRAPFRRIVFKKSGSVRSEFASYLFADMGVSALTKRNSPAPLHEWLADRWLSCSPLAVWSDRIERRRITVLTDSIGPSSLFGGVCTR